MRIYKSMFEISIDSNGREFAFDKVDLLTAVVTLRSPSIVNRRHPLDLMLICDKSGSMEGTKMDRMKETLSFMVKHGVDREDKIGLVSFDEMVYSDLKLTKMDTRGREKALDAIRGLKAGSTTNLSGGLLKGIELLQEEEEGEKEEFPEKRIRAVLLFTDGVANSGITDMPLMLGAIRSLMNEDIDLKISTFGFGADHNEDCLKQIAEQWKGMYYYVEKVDAIPAAFATCLGGLVSVVAQNASLALEACQGATFEKVYNSGYKNSETKEGTWTLDLGDLCSGAEKNILVEVVLPRLPKEQPIMEQALRARLRFFSVATNRFEEVEGTLSIARPLATPERKENMQIEEHRQRLLVAERMEEASRLAAMGDVKGGKHLLKRTIDECQASIAAGTPTLIGLCNDLSDCCGAYTDSVTYRSIGSKLSKMSAMSHFRQESNHRSGLSYSGHAASTQ